MNDIDDFFEDKQDENNNDEDKIVKNFRRDLLAFFFVANILLLLTLMLVPAIFNQTGKPAIYLYPPKPTEINVTLSKTIFIQTNIPKYHNSWHVLAHPDGKITDLQPNFTDCKKLRTDRLGFEYAQKACETNNYPYIFWDGVKMTKPVPKKQNGWVVKKSEINTFLNEKLDKIGFNLAEKTEFIRYWDYKIDKEKSDYFFIYFLQNKEVDAYAPMNVSPKPDSTNRILMVARPINKPISVKGQDLLKISRQGFALVEWGGIIKKNMWGW